MRRKDAPDSIPQLTAVGLTYVNTAGEGIFMPFANNANSASPSLLTDGKPGNCLFHALSDQLYGDQAHHTELRAATVKYMEENPDQFKAFVAVNVGGGTRRNPKRKKHKGVFDDALPTPEDVDRAWAAAIKLMKKGGTYGDNSELVAFAFTYKVDVKIYSEENGYFYVVRGVEGERLPMLYIVHHSWEHYSSIRNIDGPFSGPPEIHEKSPSPGAQRALKAELQKGVVIHPWMIDLALRSLPYERSRSSIENTLKHFKGNINHAVSYLLPDSSPDSSSRSSSIEREPDSDDEKAQKPTKKQDRRKSRPHPLSHTFAVRTGQTNPISPDPHRLAVALRKVNEHKQSDPDETEWEDWQNKASGDSDSGSFSTSASDYSAGEQQLPEPDAKSGPIRLKLSEPKKPDIDIKAAVNSNSENVSSPTCKKPNRAIAKPRRRLINGNERAQMAERIARNKMTNHTAKMQQEFTPVLDHGLRSIHI